MSATNGSGSQPLSAYDCIISQFVSSLFWVSGLHGVNGLSLSQIWVGPPSNQQSKIFMIDGLKFRVILELWFSVEISRFIESSDLTASL